MPKQRPPMDITFVGLASTIDTLDAMLEDGGVFGTEGSEALARSARQLLYELQLAMASVPEVLEDVLAGRAIIAMGEHWAEGAAALRASCRRSAADARVHYDNWN